jgi:hypothetical protein
MENNYYFKMQNLGFSLFLVVPTLGHRATVKRIVSLQFLNPKIFGWTPWTGDQPIARPLPIQTQTNNHALSKIRTHDPGVRAKTIHALDGAATVIGR